MGIAYRPEIDGLRAIAVLAVIAYHAGLGGAGFVGVDVFFVISGYLITSLLLREHEATGRIDLLHFYARRVRRIFPAAAVVVLIVLGLASVLLSAFPEAHTANSAGAALMFGANVFFQFTTGGYFDGLSEEMPLLHLWSLSVEEQFYFVWPALLIVLLRRGWAKTGIIVLGVASLLLAEALSPQAAFYQMPARFWELAAGGLIAAMPARALPRWVTSAGVLVTLAACVFAMGHFPGVGALPAVAGAALVIAAVHGGASNAMLRSRPMVWIGLISYSLYLWHWPLLALYRATTVGDGELVTRLILCAVSFPLAFASYRYVEQPFRKMRFRSGRTVAIGFGASAAFALSACMAGANVEGTDPASRAEADRPRMACHAMFFETVQVKCPSDSRTAVWGDSMAYAWMPAFPGAAQHTRDACAPLLTPLPDNPSRKDLACRDFRALRVEAAGRYDTLVLAARWQSMDGLAETLAAVAGKVDRVLILGPTPEMRDRVPVCLDNPDACAIPRAQFDERAAPILAAMHEVAAAYPNVVVIDLTDQFCTETTCPPVLDGVPLYWDTHHISSTAARGVRLP